MPADDLKAEVLRRAREEAAAVVERAKKEADTLLAQAESRARAKADSIVEAGRRQVEESAARGRSAQEREWNKRILAEKNALLAEAFSRAEARFRALPREEVAGLARKELSAADLAAGRILVPPGWKNAFARAMGKADLAEDPAVESGYVLIRPGYRLDRTLAVMMAELREEIILEVARLLFGEET